MLRKLSKYLYTHKISTYVDNKRVVHANTTSYSTTQYDHVHAYI